MHVSRVLLPITIPNGTQQCFHLREADRWPGLNRTVLMLNFQEDDMSHRFTLLLLSGAIGLTLSGCASLSSPVTRAQSPQIQPTGWETASCQSCQNCQGMGACNNGCHDPNQLINLPFHPVHRNSYTVNAPKNLMYPPSPSQAGITQYPYYTFRGPTDFFMP